MYHQKKLVCVAEPIWVQYPEDELNQWAIFETELPKIQNATLRLTALGRYRLKINGKWVGYGPAKVAHGFARVDEYDLTGLLDQTHNKITIDVVTYRIDTYDLGNESGFFLCEVFAGETVLRRTAVSNADFSAKIDMARRKKVQRYSLQRAFVEDYDLTQQRLAVPAEIVSAEPRILLQRGIKYSDYDCINAERVAARGYLEVPTTPIKDYWMLDRTARAKHNSDSLCHGYDRKELEWILSSESREFTPGPHRQDLPEHELRSGEYVLYDFAMEYSGLIGLEVECATNVRLLADFDELLIDGKIDLNRYSCANTIGYTLPAGSHTLETIEPYALRYLMLSVRSGELNVKRVWIREVANPYRPEKTIELPQCDPGYKKIFTAACRTFRQNAVDIFMDCPGRERAGWLCDSFWAARASYFLTGDLSVESNYLENFLLVDNYPSIPDGMFPMLYPGNTTTYIPNWALWFVLEVADYATRGGRPDLIEKAQKHIERLFRLFAKFENSDGLLEKLESWVFLEWSAANNYTQDVNYPSNMLYARALEVAGALYQRSDWCARAEQVRAVIREQAFNGTFFVDHALRDEDGSLHVQTDHITEVCQYYAFYMKTATVESHPELWTRLLAEFGPGRKEGMWKEVAPAAPFIGYILRLEMLSEAGEKEQVRTNILGYYLYMAEETGTLWEKANTAASCNHGFAAYIAQIIARDCLDAPLNYHQNE